MSILFGVVHLHVLDLFQKLRGKVLQVIQVGGMDMKYIRVSGDLNLYTVNLYQLVSFLNVFLVDEVIGIAWVHYNDNPVLNTLLANGEHYLVELNLSLVHSSASSQTKVVMP